MELVWEHQRWEYAGTWKDDVKGDVFTARDNTLTVSVPAHSVRFMRAETG